MSCLVEVIYDERKVAYMMKLYTSDSTALEDFWNKILTEMSKELTPTAIATWFADCKPVMLSDDTFVIGTTMDFKKKILETRYLENVQKAMAELFLWKGKITFVV